MDRVFTPYKEGNVTVLFDVKMLALNPAESASSRQIVLPHLSLPSTLPLRKIGFLLLGASFLGFFVLGFPTIVSEISYQLYRLNGQNQLQAEEKTFGDFLDERQRSKNSQQFTINIDKIGVESNIIPNVDAANPDEYEPALMQGVAHAQGSYFPGEGSLIYLFAHSTDYVFNIKNFNALFYNLKELEKGDKITLIYQRRSFTYAVSEKKIVAANDLSDLKNSGQERLILQTCWPPGTTWKRLIVIAEPI